MCNNSNLNFSSSETHNQMQQYKQFKMLALNHPSTCLASCTVYLTLNFTKMSKCIIINYCQFKERINKYCTIVDSREITLFCCQIFFFCFLVPAALYPLLPTYENHQTAIKTSYSTDVLMSKFEVNKCVGKKDSLHE